MRSCAYVGTLTHRRREPVAHAFRYRLSMFYLDLDELPQLQSASRLFGVNRGRLLRFDDRDHVDERREPTRLKVLRVLETHGVALAAPEVYLLTQVRVLGYVFNPVSFFYCHERGAGLRAIVAEVHNTFGERCLYVLGDHNRLDGDGPSVRYRTAKQLHVSPFLGMDARYDFSFSPVGSSLAVDITESEGSARRLEATLRVERRELTSWQLGWLLLRYPLMPWRITAAIHWQALRLYLKGVPVYPKPARGDRRASHQDPRT